MFSFMIQKLLHKKWMFISLLIGNILLIAIACSYPMYKNASLQRMLTDDFNQYIEKNNRYPATLFLKGSMEKESGKKEFLNKQELFNTAANTLGVPEAQKIGHYYIVETKALSLMGREDKANPQSIQIGTLSDIENHANILSGEMYSNNIGEDGFIEAIVSQRTFSKLNLLIGEEYEFQLLKDKMGSPIKIRITGVFKSSEDRDFYWVSNPNSYDNEFFISKSIFMDDLMDFDDQRYSIRAIWYVLLDYTQIQPSQVKDIMTKTRVLTNDGKSLYSSVSEPNYLKILSGYLLSEKKISATLIILQMPILVLLCSFIFMISGQMLDMEQNEIALLKSRGSGKKQILTIYFIQSVFVAIISFMVGLPLGKFLCGALGSTNAFLEFVQRRQLTVKINTEVLLYCLGTVIVSIGVMVLPVFKHANVTIVSYKLKKNKRNKRLWQRIYLDVVLLGISLYGLYSFTEQKDLLIAKVINGSPLDPFLYLSSSLFIIGASLFALRIQPILVRAVFFVGKKRWKPASYASFLQIIRTGSKQNFIMVFLMFTIALGIFNATIARTILSNADNNIKYNTGADIVLSEVWSNNQASVDRDPSLELVYIEPNIEKYKKLEGASSFTKVLIDNKVTVSTKNGSINVKLMGIHSKEFGETSWFKDNLLPVHYYQYLNILSSNANAILVSSNFHDQMEYEVGDVITYLNGDRKSVMGVIYGFVDYWPTYEPTTKTIKMNETIDVRDNFLIVAHFAQLQDKWGVKPYQIWINAQDTTDFIYDFTEKYSLEYSKFEDTSEKLKEVRNDTMFQGTNGILTMSFIVVLILSSAGFLIYWILSIRSRELLFGILRAMGMSKKEIIHILINEQIFSTGLSLAIGAIIGVLASKLFIPLIQITYATTEQFIPLELVTEQNDLVRLFSIILIVFVGCMMILGRLISKIKISQALKLGED